MSVLEMCKYLEIKTQGDLLRFKKEFVKDGESMAEALRNYIEELGVVFKIGGIE